MSTVRRLPLFLLLAGGVIGFYASLTSVSAQLVAPYTIVSETISVGVPNEEQSDATTTSKPARLVVPAIGINAQVIDVGVAESGNMAVPLTFTDVGWYRYGSKPGEKGSVVFDGHVNNGLGYQGVFAELGLLKVGDTIFVVSHNGTITPYVVEEVVSYKLAEVPLQKIFNRSDDAYLALITCDGIWDSSYSSYDRRLVVFGKMPAQKI